MSLTTPFEEARTALGLGPAEQDPAVIKQAYRRAVAKHPPDVDPDAFRRIRDAYELLRDPWARAKGVLLRPLPQVPPPESVLPTAERLDKLAGAPMRELFTNNPIDLRFVGPLTYEA